ncbi:hypothetical protein Tco_1235808 [Tanacetum coccineum]
MNNQVNWQKSYHGIIESNLIIPGRVLVPPGSVVVPPGSVVVPTGSVVVPPGSVVVPTVLDERCKGFKGDILSMHVLLEWHRKSVYAPIYKVDIEIVCKAIVIPGRVLVPPGSVVVPPGSVVVPTGSVVVPPGSVVVPTGSSPPVRRALSSRLMLQHLKKVRVQRKDSDISSGIGLDEEV